RVHALTLERLFRLCRPVGSGGNAAEDDASVAYLTVVLGNYGRHVRQGKVVRLAPPLRLDECHARPRLRWRDPDIHQQVPLLEDVFPEDVYLGPDEVLIERDRLIA